MTSNLVWEHLSSSSTSYPNLVIVAQAVFKRSRCHDDDDDGDVEDGVRGLSNKHLRQLLWVRALKMSDVEEVAAVVAASHALLAMTDSSSNY